MRVGFESGMCIEDELRLRFCKYRDKERQTTTTQATATPEETRLNQLDIEAREAVQPQQIETQQTGLNLVNLLLKGSEPLPGFFDKLAQGISPDVTQSIVDQSIRDISPQFQASGILDSGVAASISARTSADIRRASEEFNIGNRLNLLNLALSGQAQIQQPILSQSQALGGRLAGLRSVNQQQTLSTPNPFLSSFQSGLGSSFGSGNFGSFSFGKK